MAFSAVTEIMLYCPKCQSTYPSGSRRFCDNDGARLTNAPNTTNAPKTKGGIFTNLLGRTLPTNQTDEKLASTPKFVPFNPPAEKQTELIVPKNIELPKTEEVFELDLDLFDTELPKSELKTESESDQEIVEPKDVPIAKPYARIIKPNEIASGTAEVGDRRTNPAGRDALSWENPQALIGQTVKGRYEIIKILGEDDESISYLAEDKILPEKKVFVRVFMEEYEVEDFSSAIFAEERVSLSHINHPNIAKLIDSSELLEGKSFIVTEFVEGKTIKDMLNRTGQFNALRTARIIRQASYGLSEAHQNGVLHRNLKPESIILSVSEAGTEQVKLTNFGILYDKINENNLAYKAPEQVEGKLANYASDIYSLAIIAYQMLTNRLPFNAASVETLRKSQKEGLTVLPTNLRLDVPPLVDDILIKALSPNPTERYPKARDFGDAFFNAVTTSAPWEEQKTALTLEPKKEKEKNYVVLSPINPKQTDVLEEEIAETVDIEEKTEAKTVNEDFVTETEEIGEIEEKIEEELPWEKRSPDTVRESNPHWLMIGIFALGLLLFAGVWYYLWTRQNTPDNSVVTSNPSLENTSESMPVIQTPAPVSDEINETPPIKRNVEQPPNTNYFQSSKQGLEGDLAKNFLGFSLYYPNNWSKSNSKTEFLDISNKTADGLPVKQVLITRYESKGLYSQDKANFPKLVEKSNKDLRESNPNSTFRIISQGETTIQNGRWKAYEVRFEQKGKVGNDGELTLWGRRFWIPIQRPGKNSGYVITLVATSLAPNIERAENFVIDEELNQILETFEPESSY